MVEDVESFLKQTGCGFQRVHVQNTEKLAGLLEELTFHAVEHRMRPLLHLDMHGNEKHGLHIAASNEYVSWEELAVHLRRLNAATENNLCVVSAACFGLRAIMPVKLDQPTPFFVLIAPETVVKTGFLEKNIPEFYRELFQTGGIDNAYERHLSEKFKYFHCEKMLFTVVAKYIREGCKGGSGQARRERLLTEAFMQGLENTEDNRREIRRKIKDGLRPSQALLDRYASTFLVGRACSFDMERLLSAVNGSGS